ncbi:pentapeptide repeat-containing protein [Paenibacillus sp. 32352]|uniref:pentapeptide repeat-containing protein n=1 Tax=Paenibacillus sp. 32352 TaxID=1969111 RepID=UPI0009AC3115|nr:pentapeptide repeat-containing protein [Paenibacillus sp. 32352]
MSLFNGNGTESEQFEIKDKGARNQQILLSQSTFSGSEFVNARGEKVSFRNVSMPETSFRCSDLRNLRFTDINLSGTRISDANLSDLEIDGAQLGGAYIHNIGLPPAGHPAYVEGAKQRPLRFENCDLNGSSISDCTLDGVSISDCSMEGMTINGIPVLKLLEAYHKLNGTSSPS